MSGLDREPHRGDAFGEALLAYHDHGEGVQILERDDGAVDALPSSVFFDEPSAWHTVDRAALEHVTGRVLDIGTGAGRFSLALQDRGHEVIGIDSSPGAVDVCERRGASPAHLGSIYDYTPEGRFDSLLLMGHNIGIFASEERIPILFDRLRPMLRPGGAVIGTSLDPHLDDTPRHVRYRRRNVERGRMPGQIRMRVRHEDVAGEWFDWLFLSPAELDGFATASGWALENATDPDPHYLAVLRPI